MATPSNKNMLLLSGSKAAGGLPKGVDPVYLDWAEPWIREFFAKVIAEKKPILFVPYVRPDGKSEKAYFDMTGERLAKMGIDAVCAPAEGITEETLKNLGGIFIGGGHTPTLLHKLQQTGSLDVIRKSVEAGMPYVGSSAGTLIACPTIKTNNDMPGPAHDIIDVRSMGLIGAQLNCHYFDKSMENPQHQGETRDTRLKEFCTFNPGKAVLGLYEGQALRVTGDKTKLWTSKNTRGTRPPVFIDNKRDELECEIDVPKDVSEIFKVHGEPERVPEKQPRSYVITSVPPLQVSEIDRNLNRLCHAVEFTGCLHLNYGRTNRGICIDGNVASDIYVALDEQLAASHLKMDVKDGRAISYKELHDGGTLPLHLFIPYEGNGLDKIIPGLANVLLDTLEAHHKPTPRTLALFSKGNFAAYEAEPVITASYKAQPGRFGAV